jgi:two-component system OmpR family sensor kinase
VRRGHHRGRHVERFVARYGIKPFLAWRLHRRVFAWFGMSMVVTALVVGGSMHLLNRGQGRAWSHDLEGTKHFVGAQFGRVWSSAGERRALAMELARDLDATVELRDRSGALLEQVGEPCARGGMEATVPGEGSVKICMARFGPPPAWKVLLVGGMALLALWLLAGRIARRLMRPLSMVIEVAEELGKGNLKTRIDLDSCRAMGDERALAGALNQMADRIERQMGDQRELLAQVSHELRTPLGHIRLLLELAREGAPSARTLDELDREVQEIDALVADLLASSRVTFDALTLRELSAQELGARALERAGLPSALLTSEAELTLDGDATLLMRALANLLENARAHGGGATALQVSATAEHVRFAVRDAGPGFATGDEVRAFDPFFHRPRAEADGHGSLGLGLALVQRIAVAHGGTATAQNVAAGGAEVSFTVRAG